MEKFYIGEVPAALYGEKAGRVFIYIHGKLGCKEEAAELAELICPFGWQILAIDLPEHGERKNSGKLLPWLVIPELKAVLDFAKSRWDAVSLCAVSIGAYFSLLGFEEESFEKCLFISPLLDMQKLIENMMSAAHISPERLEKEGEADTDFGERLSWEYYLFAKDHPIVKWPSPTAVFYAGRDMLTSRETAEGFAGRFGASLHICEDSEHYIHTPQAIGERNEWIKAQLR